MIVSHNLCVEFYDKSFNHLVMKQVLDILGRDTSVICHFCSNFPHHLSFDTQIKSGLTDHIKGTSSPKILSRLSGKLFILIPLEMYLVNLSPIFILIFCGAPAVVSAGDGEGSALRMHQIYETTSWDLLEDLYLYHNAIRYFHESSGLRFNRTVSLNFLSPEGICLKKKE